MTWERKKIERMGVTSAFLLTLSIILLYVPTMLTDAVIQQMITQLAFLVMGGGIMLYIITITEISKNKIQKRRLKKVEEKLKAEEG